MVAIESGGFFLLRLVERAWPTAESLFVVVWRLKESLVPMALEIVVVWRLKESLVPMALEIVVFFFLS